MGNRHFRIRITLLASLGLCAMVACGRGLGTRPVEADWTPPESTQVSALPLEVQGRVINAQGLGVEGLSLRLEASDIPVLAAQYGLEQSERFLCTTNGGGYFRVEIPSSTNHLLLSVEFDGQAFYPWNPSFLENSGTNLGAFFLPERRRIAGQIVDAEENGRAGVPVRVGELIRAALLVPEGFWIHEHDDYLWLAEAKPKEQDWPDLGILSLTTDAEGRFSVEGYFSDPWVAWTDTKGIPHGQGCAYSGDWADLQLSEHATVAESFAIRPGKVSDLTQVEVISTVSHCLPNLQVLGVQSIDQEQMVRMTTELPFQEQEQGHFYGPSMAYRLHAQAPWVLRSSFWGYPSLPELLLEAPQDLQVQLQDEEGEAIEDALLQWAATDSLDPSLPGQGLELPAFASLEPGTWLAKGVPPGNLMAWVESRSAGFSAASWAPYPLEAHVPDWHQAQTLTLHRAAHPVFQVTAGKGRQPVAGAIIQAGPWVQWSDHDGKCEEHENSYLGNRGVTDADGRWTPASLCQRGAWIYVLYGGSLMPFAWDGSNGEHAIHLGEMAMIQGTVMSGDTPAPELVLSLTPIEDDHLQVRLCVDDQGRFQLPMMAGEYVLEHGPFDDAFWTQEGDLVESILLEAGDAMELLLYREQP